MLTKSSTLKLFLILTLSTAQISFAQDIFFPSNNYKTIQQAIDEIVVPGKNLIASGIYTENLTLKSDVILQGVETARTIIDSPNTSPAISIANRSNVTIRNLTLSGSSIGIQVTNSTNNIVITNNVFVLGTSANTSGTAIDVTDTTSDVKIIFNTFHGNNIAIDRESNLTIENNIFSGNTTDIQTGPLETNINFNCFDSSITAGSNFVASANISFADIGSMDFHLQTQAAPPSCIDLINASGKTDAIDGTIADAGAYGGDLANLLPYPPQDVSVDDTTMAPNIVISWNQNLSYLITNGGANEGGYKIHYGFQRSGLYNGTNATVGDSPIDVGHTITKTLTNLTIPPSTIIAPVVSISPSSHTLDVSWPADSNVTNYTLNYGITSVTENTEPSLTGTSFTITGLTNNVTYKVMVTAHFQPKYYFAVKAYDNTSAANESDFSKEHNINVGAITDKPSDTVTSIPELVVLFPDLPGDGCFIATAAFGYYSAPEVQVLRDFRDQYLLSNQVGKNFVDWYYTYGRAAAQYLHIYPELKPIVRILLFPLIYYAKFLLNTSVMTQILTSLLLTFLLILFINSRFNNKNATYNI